jgi:chemotaxis protein methyltransferase CheR
VEDRHRPSPQRPSEPTLRAVARWVGAKTGLALPDSRLFEAEQAVRRAMEKDGVDDAEAWLVALAAGDAPADALIDELTIRETSFFRHPEHFALLRDTILPERAAARPPGHVLRVWSAGCASGEEAWSLRVTLDEAGWGGRSEVVATDIAPAALSRARAAVYRPWSMRGVDDAVRERLFAPTRGASGEELALRRGWKHGVRFLGHNLVVDPPAVADADVIFCRNVLLHVDRPTIRVAAIRLYEALAPGGWLVAGPSDPPLGDEAPFEVRLTSAGFVYRRPPATARPAEPPPALVLPPARRRATPEPADAIAAARGLMDVDPAAALRACTEALARHPLSVELRWLSALLHASGGDDHEAIVALHRALALDPGLVVGWLLLGTVLARTGDASGSARALRNTIAAARDAAPGPQPLADGATAAELAEAAGRELARMARGIG